MKRTWYLGLIITSGLLAAAAGLFVVWLAKLSVGYIPEANPWHAFWSGVATASFALPALLLAAAAVLAFGAVRPVPRWAPVTSRWFAWLYAALLLPPSLLLALRSAWYLLLPVPAAVLGCLRDDPGLPRYGPSGRPRTGPAADPPKAGR